MGRDAQTSIGDGFRPVKSADRALGLLELLASSSRAWRLGDLADELQIPKSSLHGLLQTLQHRGWVESVAGETAFRLGVRALLVGASYVDTDVQVLRSRDALDRLADLTGETVHLGRLDGADVVYLAKRESSHPLRLFSAVGRRLPAHATALGKAILAEHDGADVRARLPRSLAAMTERTITDLPTLEAELDAVRDRGYAIDDEESTLGIRCLAVALRTATGSRDAVSISIPTVRLDDRRAEEAITALLDAQQELSEGARGGH